MHTIPDEGYIKFRAKWTKTAALPWSEELEELNHWRQQMYRAGLIGAFDNGIGFGNISRRWDESGRFVISGSATGNLAELSAAHYALVTEVAIHQNELSCAGPILASSESMSHAVIYQACEQVNGVIHVHHLHLWEALLHRAPTTDKGAPYGSPEMADSILELLRNTDLKTQKIFVMEGHREGIFAFGETLAEAAAIIFGHFSAVDRL